MLVAIALAVAACTGPTLPRSITPAPSTTEPSASTEACAGPTASTPTTAWWGDHVFYEVFVRSFADSDGDGIGDLRGLTAHLDDLNDGDPVTSGDLGVTGLWLMPIAESPSYHGYDVVDYRAVESDYGTPADLRALVLAAHERGIAVILDLVINHTSRDHPWFQDARTPGSPHDAWYLWADDHPGIARSDGSRVWHPDGDRFYYGYFWEGMPDLNLENPEVTAALDGIADFWLGEMGVDGFRIDAARHLIEDGRRLENADATFDWLAGFRDRIKERHPDALVLGEVWDASSMSARYIREGALDLTFDFGLAGATIISLKSRDGGALRAAMTEVSELYRAGELATFLTNHDQNRLMTELGGDVEAAKLAAALLLTGGGTPFVYYGEEIGLTGGKPDERIRTPMRWDTTAETAGFTTGQPWQSLGEDPAGTDVATQTADPDSLYSTYRRLIALRATHPALSVGGLAPVRSDEATVVAFLRHAADETILVVANLTDQPTSSVTLDLEAGPLCRVASMEILHGTADFVLPTVTAQGGFDAYQPVPGLRPREVLVFGFGR